jgi:hypothetical protein
VTGERIPSGDLREGVDAKQSTSPGLDDAPRQLRLQPSSKIHARGANPLRMSKIHEALRIKFDVIEPTASGYRLSNSSNPDQETIWLSKEEWRHLCRVAGWSS